MGLFATIVVAAVVWGVHVLCSRIAGGLVRLGLEATVLASLTAALVEPALGASLAAVTVGAGMARAIGRRRPAPRA
jgi:GMP synthase PP-ATPase subunit